MRIYPYRNICVIGTKVYKITSSKVELFAVKLNIPFNISNSLCFFTLSKWKLYVTQTALYNMFDPISSKSLFWYFFTQLSKMKICFISQKQKDIQFWNYFIIQRYFFWIKADYQFPVTTQSLWIIFHLF